MDGAFCSRTRQGGWGFIIRDHLGIMIAGGAGPSPCLVSAEHAEAIACSKAVEFAQVQGFSHAILETDALEVKRQLDCFDSSNTSVLGRLYDDLKFHIRDQGLWKVSHTHRLGNIAAHSLAAHACSLLRDEFYFSTPSFLAAVVTAEQCIM